MNTGRLTSRMVRLAMLVVLCSTLAIGLWAATVLTIGVSSAAAHDPSSPSLEPPHQGVPPYPRPERVVMDYFTAINNRQYDVSWSFLSENYRYNWTCCTPDGRLDRGFYNAWWDRVLSVNIGPVYIISRGVDTVVVYADVSYQLISGETVPEFMPYFELVYDRAAATWLINGKGATADPRLLPTPEQTVRDYYAAVASHQYHITWPMLSRSFKTQWNCCTPAGDFDFAGYAEWWDSVSRVEVAQAVSVAQTERTATVYAELVYYTKSGRVIQDPAYISLALEDTTPFQAWIFTGKQASSPQVAPTPTPPIGPVWQMPAQVIRSYYSALGNRRYDAAWAMLSDNFKHNWTCCTPGHGYDYGFYTAWWNRVQRISLGDMYVVRQDGASAVVFANASYQLDSGDWVSDMLPYKALTFDAASGGWLLDGQAASADVHALPSADQAVRDYYAAVSAHQYDISWPMLSYSFKQSVHCCTMTGDFDFQEYVAWWDTVARVEVSQVWVVEQSAQTARVYADLRYVKKNGAASYDPAYIYLTLDSKTPYPAWVITRVRPAR